MKILFDLDDFNDLEEIFFKEESPISRLDIARKVMSSEVMARKHEIYYYLLRNSVQMAVEEGDMVCFNFTLPYLFSGNITTMGKISLKIFFKRDIEF